MAPSTIPSPDTITKADFSALLEQYPALVDAISESKGSKPGQKSLRELDEYRYTTALENFGTASSSQEMTLGDVKLLVEWKLRHGKFRPMLMGLASSNNAKEAKRTISASIRAYREQSPASDAAAPDAAVATALASLAKLRGIGPATASLLLTVHDPARVIFFSDEAYYWLCGGGQVSRLKYSNREYELLRKNADQLVKRLGVSATDVEKVAYVLLKRDTVGAGADKPKAKTASTAKVAKSAKEAVKDTKKVAKSKRKESTNQEEAAVKDTKKVAKSKRKQSTTQEEAASARRTKRVKK